MRGNAEPSALARGNHAFPERPISRRRSDEAIQSAGAVCFYGLPRSLRSLAMTYCYMLFLFVIVTRRGFLLGCKPNLLYLLFSIHFSFFYNGVFSPCFPNATISLCFSKQGTLAQISHVPCFSLSLYSFLPFFYSYLVGFFSYFSWKEYDKKQKRLPVKTNRRSN